MTGMPPPLPEGVRVETFTYTNGKTETIYKRAMSEEGPALRIEGGVRYLVYSHHVERRDVTITGTWNPDNLIHFGRRW